MTNLVDVEHFKSEGWLIIDLNGSGVDFDQIKSDVDEINCGKFRRLNPKIYHYNTNPRVIEAWKQSREIKNLALNETVLDCLRQLYGKEPIAFSTINFTKGTEQPLHSDYFHFGSKPELMLAGVWVALEDISADSGPLSIVPKSHLGPIVLPEDLGIESPPRNMLQVKANYSLYEKWVANYVTSHGFEILTPKISKGQALIWAANLLHGACAIENSTLTRYSQVTHYHFEGCEFFYNPNFSTRKHYVLRDVHSSRIF